MYNFRLECLRLQICSLEECQAIKYLKALDPVSCLVSQLVGQDLLLNLIGMSHLLLQTVLKRLRGDEQPTMAQCAEAEVTTRWLGFHRVRHGTGEIFDTVDLFLPDVQFPTQVCDTSSFISREFRAYWGLCYILD